MELLTYPTPQKQIGSKLAKKSYNTQLFYIMCYVALFIMNPLIKRTTEKVIGHEIRPEDMSIAVIIGYAISEAIEASRYNPNYNLKGGMDVDENTIGNFRVPNAT